MRLWHFGLILGIALWLQSSVVESHHNGGRLPLVPNTWLIQTMLADGEVRWCVDNRARDFPDFLADIQAVNDAATQALGIPHRRIEVNVPGSDTLEIAKAKALAVGCMILHRIPDNHGCSGCAAWILYSDRPAVVEYKLAVIASYSDLKTTQAHEGTNCGHAMGEHEAYDDTRAVSHIATYGFWASPWNGPTVMDVNSQVAVMGGVWQCTANDVRLLCSWLDPNKQRFTACGYAPPPCPDPCWNGQDWVYASGWRYRPSTDEWFDNLSRLFWQARNGEGWRFSPVSGNWEPSGNQLSRGEIGKVVTP